MADSDLERDIRTLLTAGGFQHRGAAVLPEPRRARPATAPPRSSARAEEQAAAEDVAAKQTAARAAVEQMRPFAAAFDNELRGLAYYAVWLGIQDKKPDLQDLGDDTDPKAALLEKMQNWWLQSIRELHAHVTSKTQLSSESVRAAAFASLESYVDKMSAIPFHACRQSEAFLRLGRGELRVLSGDASIGGR